jgi:hypothetical protein
VDGRRYRSGIALDSQPVDLGAARSAILRTNSGLLLVADGKIRLGSMSSASSTPLPNAISFRALVRTPSSENIIALAASPSSVAMLRGAYTSHYSNGSSIAVITTREGEKMREFPIDAHSAVIASDGDDLLRVDRGRQQPFAVPAPAGGRASHAARGR